MKRFEKEKQQETIDQFCNAQNLKDIAELINIPPKNLSYILYILGGGRENQYETFEIKKRGGGIRKISAPSKPLKEVQRRLNELLQIIYWEKPSVHSFIKKRSIITNARCHIHKRFVFNIDLKDFFPSINFGRVRGLFIARPYSLNKHAATVIAQIACFANQLPQGSPCSPIISNMICSKMDKELQLLAKKEYCTYTRYADDMTFSTNLPSFPKNIAYIKNDEIVVGDDLKNIIESNWFKINEEKIKLQTVEMRQEVTGLIVNKFANVRRKLVRQVRAMLHAWEKWGLDKAEKEYYSKYKPLSKNDTNKDFKSVVLGKISFIDMVRKEKKNKKRIKLYSKRADYYSKEISYKLLVKYYELLLREGDLPIIRTEGPTDWMHLLAAWRYFNGKKKYKSIEIDFFKVKNDICFGDSTLLSFCEMAKNLRPFKKKIICIFDSDNDKYINKHKKDPVKYWGNNVYSFVIPKPKDYADKPVSIEFYYDKKVIRSKDENGRRLFFSDEFKPNGTHKKLKNVRHGFAPKTKKTEKKDKQTQSSRKIIDSRVYKKKGDKTISIALSKYNFAKNIFYKEKGFEKVDFKEFDKIFSIVATIIEM